MSNLSLNGIINVDVTLTPSIVYQRGYNTALIVGPYSETPQDVTEIKFYEDISAVLEDYANTTEVYKTASLYFSQSSVPQGVYILCQASGASLAETLQLARESDSEWYVAIPVNSIVSGLTTTTLNAASTYIESATPASLIAYSFTNSSTYISMMNALKLGKFMKTISQYDDPTTYTENAGKACIAGIIGYAMGNNNTLSNSYSLAYKSVSGLVPINNFTSSQLNALLAENGNIYINQGYYYNLFRQGKMASGDSFDEIVYIDMLVDQLKASLMNVLVNNPKVSQTEIGVSTLKVAITDVLERFRAIDFIAPGIWNGASVLSLEPGDALATGYFVQFDSIASQTAAQRAARIAPNCYICIKLAGAIEHVVISLVANK